ncbi:MULTISPECIES: carbonic anhydrase [Mycobacteriaceae]|uniref:carbonic anhydrase n=1 Tax=Mycobacteriaceae TaxID=1762 RepID=UPI0009939E05|nr:MULTISPECIES: carbonic anhydrase [Mycobacteriaceae]MDM2175068.1 carbonic anhydrase [Mycobacteroides abscessus]SKL50617.1 Probable transmembrane carbonic anhydrase [Mycobacteroides abscessus subsp. bolletii]MDM2179767.1 carbonic anhydrase [Mycobacteroides abscessus]MDM2207802.1 carbonic anhydrase [Mycobacteroides abscessus]MDM2211452.1 carbonic anhydrase [Mycobacteroides abscessus]
MTSFLDSHTLRPDALYLACSDGPGLPKLTGGKTSVDLFTVRNIANLVPTDPADGSVDAALDFAVNQHLVRSIVVCGHSGCGAMKTLLSESIDTPTSPVGRWLHFARDALIAYHDYHLARVSAAASGFSPVDQLAVVNVAIQLERLVHHPILAAAASSGRLHVAGAFFSTGSSQAFEVNTKGLAAASTR